MLAERQPSPQLNLFIEHEWIDTKRVAKILGVTNNTVHRMVSSGLLKVMKFDYQKKSRVRYASVVDLCDRLRVQHHIPDRRPVLSAPGLRHRDRDLLPFPMSDTLSVSQAMGYLGLSKDSVYHLIEEGRFEAYRFEDKAPYRISQSSLAKFMDDSRNSPSPYAAYQKNSK
jgi:excisionase family DNA binding protein